ncbi:MAG TPA: carbon-nitrogen hydrolase family protein [Saprospiraceae bacterium]|nr:carbon-nitrogen hydrolase family protein [Saprospiraceae bacterium]
MKTKVAVVQASSVLFDLEASLAKVERLVAQASHQGARLVLFPEAFLSAYPRGLSFGTVVGGREPSGREDWLLYYEHALAVPGPAADYLGEIARRFQVWLVIGVIERADRGGTLYCTLLYYNPQGKLVQKHRKLKPTAAERIIWGEGTGDDLQAVDAPFGKMGGLICWENYMPLARMNLYQQGVEIYLAPTADQRGSWTASMQHIACEGRCYVLSCNQMVRKADYPARFQAELSGQAEIMSRGGSLIVSPLGEIVAGPLFDEEGILYAEIDRREVIKGKLDFDPVGHYRRTDVFDFQWKQETKS